MSIFMQYGSTRGDSADSQHAGWIDIDGIHWGISRRITSNTGTRFDRESSNAETSELTMTRYMDRASPALFLLACCGRGQDLTLHMTKTGSGSGADTFAVFTLKNALISEYKVHAGNDAGMRASETLIVSFTAVQVRNTPYADDGSALASVVVGFDTATNRIV